MAILGISAFHHDASASLLIGGEVVAAVQEERFSGVRHDRGFPTHAIRFVLDFAGLTAKDLEAVAVYEKPYSRLFRVLRSQARAAPLDPGFVLRSAPEWLGDWLFIRRRYREDLKAAHKSFGKFKVPLLFADHQLAHAAAAFFASPYPEAAVMILDAPGGWTASSWWHGQGNTLERIAEQRHPDSPYLLHGGMAGFLGFPVLGGAYRLMGLAGYGDETDPNINAYRDLIRQQLVDLCPDGTLRLNPQFFHFTRTERMLREDAWSRLFKMRPRRPGESIQRDHANLALAMQLVVEEIFLRQAKTLRKRSGAKKLCFGGDLALNATANARLRREGLFEDIYVPPAPGNAGAALGAALAVRHLRQGHRREADGERDGWRNALLGPLCSESETTALAEAHSAVFEKMETAALLERLVQDIEDGRLVAWCQDRMAFGSMALGSRSILADPRRPEIQRRVNVKVKYRSSFRPLGAVVMAKDVPDLFVNGQPTPYMAFTDYLAKQHRKVLEPDFHAASIKVKQHTQRSEWPAVTHVDFSVRAQAVYPARQPLLYRLLELFKAKTGSPMLLSTGFNLKGKPLVSDPEDAYHTFMQSDLDALVIGSYYFDKRRQPEWEPETLYR
jgi:carbamoyltransferase